MKEPCGLLEGESMYQMFYPDCYTIKEKNFDPPEEIIVEPEAR